MSDLPSGPSFKVKQGYPNLRVLGPPYLPIDISPLAFYIKLQTVGTVCSCVQKTFCPYLTTSCIPKLHGFFCVPDHPYLKRYMSRIIHLISQNNEFIINLC